ncbi:hypothetical protein Ade02nite_54200 [Paractinoplanes deccanensis]|uniref:DUF4037 domain-containing protein n=1 Tax=Paractinoplanes deccanensis TaxID=113561 RepID=A0ABQ3Y9T5_9ACTN|nr:DUF4037 domain-containing protein [Actinoplanes deccanensis]GID76779.1 hypothetical protein Ade02nite_54200 [Actinoplanes deccanensis]
MPDFLPGVQLARHYYFEAVRPLLGGLPHAAARLGPGSDVLGFDTARSTDHDWGPRLELFVDHPGDLRDMLTRRLPKSIRGWPTHFVPPGARVRSMQPTDGPVDHYIQILSFPAWSRDLLGFTPTGDVRPLDWLGAPWQRFAEFTGGAVFHDPDRLLTTARARLTWYPPDLWRYVLACQWRRIDQEEPFPARAAEAGDELGARVLTARLCRDVARLLLLQQRRWPPYSKWLTRALPPGPATDSLLAALHATTTRDRENALCTALEHAATRQNELGLSAEQPPIRREFFDRGYAVIGAARYADALRDAITDPALRALPFTGCADQIIDNTEVLVDAHLTRAVVATTLTPPSNGGERAPQP